MCMMAIFRSSQIIGRCKSLNQLKMAPPETPEEKGVQYKYLCSVWGFSRLLHSKYLFLMKRPECSAQEVCMENPSIRECLFLTTSSPVF